jgi:hypothetical protein
MKRHFILYFFLLFFVISAAYAAEDRNLSVSTADHRKFEVLKQDFKSGPEVTKACLSCHTEASKEVHKSIHWKWEWDKGTQAGIGKKNVINNF